MTIPSFVGDEAKLTNAKAAVNLIVSRLEVSERITLKLSLLHCIMFYPTACVMCV